MWHKGNNKHACAKTNYHARGRNEAISCESLNDIEEKNKTEHDRVWLNFKAVGKKRWVRSCVRNAPSPAPFCGHCPGLTNPQGWKGQVLLRPIYKRTPGHYWNELKSLRDGERRDVSMRSVTRRVGCRHSGPLPIDETARHPCTNVETLVEA